MSRLDLYDIHEGRVSSFKNLIVHAIHWKKNSSFRITAYSSLEGLSGDIGSNRHDHSSASPLLYSSAMEILQGSTANRRVRSLLVPRCDFKISEPLAK